MVRAVLLDMDNTLLVNPDRAFAAAFLQLFESFMQAELGFELGSKTLRRTIQEMSQPRSGDETNFDLILRIFHDASGIDVKVLQQAIHHFYDVSYPTLRKFITPVAGATDLIHRLHTDEFQIVIATNPIYPLTAIKQRMEWASLPTDGDCYQLVTSAENMHFAKPDPAYYAEILGRIGVEPNEAVMVGDRLDSDIYPARMIGMHTVHISEESSLSNFYHNLTEQPEPKQVLEPKMIESQLRGNVGAIFGLVQELEDLDWEGSSLGMLILQRLCFMAKTEHTYFRPQIEAILAESDDSLGDRAVSATKTTLCAENGYQAACLFHNARQQTIETLQTLSPEHWQHSTQGSKTLLEAVYDLVRHDRHQLNSLRKYIQSGIS